MRGHLRSVVTGSLLLVTSASASAQGVRLPVPEGIWVKTDTACEKAFTAHVYASGRFGTVYLYGPNQSMGPANETEAVTRVGRGTEGFTIVNDGPLEVMARPNGQAVVRAFSPSQGAQWSEAVRRCPAASLPARMRQGLARERLLPSSAGK
jgi:hypothetical protein